MRKGSVVYGEHVWEWWLKEGIPWEINQADHWQRTQPHPRLGSEPDALAGGIDGYGLPTDGGSA